MILLSEKKKKKLENRNFHIFLILYKKRPQISGLRFAKLEIFFHHASESIVLAAWTYSFHFQWDVWYTRLPEPQPGSTQNDGSMDCRAPLPLGITDSLMLFVATPYCGTDHVVNLSTGFNTLFLTFWSNTGLTRSKSNKKWRVNVTE